MPLSSRSEARDAMYAVFQDAWAANAPVGAVALYEDAEGDPPSSGTWARTQIHHNNQPQSAFGDGGKRRYRNDGLFTIEVFTPVGDGLQTSDALVDALIRAFRQNTAANGAVLFRNARGREIGNDGGWHQTNIIVDFEYDMIE